MELVDTSVLARKSHALLHPWLSTAIAANELAICDMVALELLQAEARPGYIDQVMESLEAYVWIRMDQTDWRRAREVMMLLAREGNQLHRSVKIADLLIAAAAERADLPLVHYDQDYVTIGELTGQPVRWAVPRGTI